MRDNSQQSNSKSDTQDIVPELQYAPVTADSKSGILFNIVIKSVMWLALAYWAFYKCRLWYYMPNFVSVSGGYDTMPTRVKVVIIYRAIIDPLMLAVAILIVLGLIKRKKRTPLLFAILLLEYVYFQVCAIFIPTVINLARYGRVPLFDSIMKLFRPQTFAEWIALTALSVYFLRSRRVKQLFRK